MPFVELHGREAGMDLPSNRIFTRGRFHTFTMTPAAGAANITNVSLQAVDYFGTPVLAPVQAVINLSDNADGSGLTAVTASGTVVAGASGVDLSDFVTKKSKFVMTNAAGLYILQITDTAKTNFKVVLGGGGSQVAVLGTLTTANYG